MRQTKTNKGFTLGETMVVVAIISVLVSLGVVAVWNYTRTIHQLEMDGIAKEIFVAAQNHLTMADSQGLLEGKAKGRNDGETETGVYYFVVGKDGTYPDSTVDNVLDLMLPVASVDETVRLNGSYVIRYDAASARVLDVFFDWRSGRFSHVFDTDSFAAEDYRYLLDECRDTASQSKRENRRNYGTEKAVIGWYGGDMPQELERGADIKTPAVQVINAERLWVEISNPNQGAEYTQAGLRLIITGEISKTPCVVELIDSSGNLKDVVRHPNKAANTKETMTVLLDDVTDVAGRHFKDLFGDKGLIPGENITIQAVAYNNHKLTNVAYSAGVTTNSLFGDLKTADAADPTVDTSHARAVISNIRHLENLSHDISGINQFYQLGTGADMVTVKSAQQSSDLDWKQFMSAITGIDVGGTDYDKVSVYTTGLTADPDGCFYPVDLPESTSYDGDSHGIQNLNVNHDGPAGVFGTLNNCTLKKLYVYNTVDDDTALSVTGSGNAGGLVGRMHLGSVQNSAAAVYVKSTGGDAGGLVGVVDAAGVERCYSGGHTVNGAYRALTDGEGRYNVQAAHNVGGLAGSMENNSAVITNCYSTCSAYSADTTTYSAGALVGSANAGSISGSYCTGLVGGGVSKGAFAGSVNAANLNSGAKNYCFGSINPGVSAVGSDAANGDVGSIDESADTYQSFYPAVPDRTAAPYDNTLKTVYRGFYPLTNATGVDNTHYGDWPAPEAFVINR